MTQITKLSSLRFGHDKKAPSEINARKSGRLDGIEALAASIKFYLGKGDKSGLILPLCVTKPNGGEEFFVVDGNRRLAALHQLRKAGVIEADHVVPILESRVEDASSKSLVANITQLPLHPVDRFERFAELSKAGMMYDEIAACFGIKLKEVKQSLALGALSPKVRAAWREGLIDAKTAQVFTLTDHKRQNEVLAKVAGHDGYVSDWAARREIVGERNYSALFNLVSREQYEKAGGKVVVDLFGDDHIVSDPALLKTLADEAIRAKCVALVGDGWSFACTEEDLGSSRWQMHQLNVTPRYTKEQKARLKEIENALDEQSPADHEDALAAEADAIEEAGLAAAFTPELKKKSGCVLWLDHKGNVSIDYGRVLPSKTKAETSAPAKKADAEHKAPAVSMSLNMRLSEQLSDAIADCLKADVDLALAAIVAGFGGGGSWGGNQPIAVEERGLRTKQGGPRKKADFATSLAELVKVGRNGQLNALAEVAARAVDTQVQRGSPPLKEKSIAALANATKAAVFRKAISKRFDAKDYFGSVSKALCLKAVEEAVNREQARKMNAWGKAEIVKFCVTNLTHSKWLPSELRTVHYDGPGAKR